MCSKAFLTQDKIIKFDSLFLLIQNKGLGLHQIRGTQLVDQQAK